MMRGSRNAVRYVPSTSSTGVEETVKIETPQVRRKPIILLPPTSTNLETWIQFIIIEIRSTMPALSDRLRNKSTFTQNGKEYQAYDDDDVPIVSKTVEEESQMSQIERDNLKLTNDTITANNKLTRDYKVRGINLYDDDSIIPGTCPAQNY